METTNVVDPPSLDSILDEILIPRPNGSEALEEVGRFLLDALEQAGALVTRHDFVATPHGFQIVWSVVLLMMLSYGVALSTRHYAVSLALIMAVPVLLLAEFELLLSPISGLAPLTQSNVVGTFPGQEGGPTLVFCAHYDTTTHLGDHYSWGRWGAWQGPATALAILLPLAGMWMRRRGRPLSVFNLESVGASRDLAYIAEDGFAMTRYRSPDSIVELVNDTASAIWGETLAPRDLPFGTLTDGRSFLAQGIPALTLRAFIGDSFPRGLHSVRDSRDRLNPEGIERTVDLLYALIDRVDRDPSLLDALASSGDAGAAFDQARFGDDGAGPPPPAPRQWVQQDPPQR